MLQNPPASSGTMRKRWEKKRYLDIDLLYELKESQPVKKGGKRQKAELISIGKKSKNTLLVALTRQVPD